jgi:hypothetical protein
MEALTNELRMWLEYKIRESREDMSGTNEYHAGRESAFETVLEYLDENN